MNKKKTANSFFNVFKKIISSKIVISKPKKKDILIWGVPKFIDILKKPNYTSVDYKKINFIHVWGESYNIHVLIKCLFKLKFRFLDYTNEFVKMTRPKIILSFLDNYKLFYMIEKNKNQIKILIQNALRSNETNIFNHKKYLFNKVDYVFCHNKNIGNKYHKLLGSKIIPSGSFLSNHVPIDKNKKKYDILYISTLRLVKKMDSVINKNVTYKDWFDSEIKLIKNIYKFTRKNNYKLFILSSNKVNLINKERKVFTDILGKEKYWEMIKRNSYDYSFPYKVIDKAKIVLGIDSTLLHESFSRGHKTIFFDIRTSNKYLKKHRHFAYPKKFKENGPFWINQNNFNSIERITNKILELQSSNWNKIKDKYLKHLMVYDENNETFNRVLKKYLNK